MIPTIQLTLCVLVYFQFLKSQRSKGCSSRQTQAFLLQFRTPLLWYTISLTKPLQSISHGLVFHHVNEPPSQAEMGENEENRLQDVIDIVQLLLRQNQVPMSRMSRKQPPPAKCDPCCDWPLPLPPLQPHKNSRIRNALPWASAMAPLDSQCCCVAQDANNTSKPHQRRGSSAQSKMQYLQMVRYKKATGWRNRKVVLAQTSCLSGSG